VRPKFQRRTIEERFEVSRYTPSPESYRAARERTQDLLMVFMHDGARYDAIGPLVESCYLQGVNDAGTALQMLGYEIVKRPS
jgi:hypothetical protein